MATATGIGASSVDTNSTWDATESPRESEELLLCVAVSFLKPF